LKSKHENFTIFKNNQGSISLLGATFTTILSLFLLFLVLKMQVEYREAKYRKQTYLCFKYLSTQTSDYVSMMTKFNWMLRTAYVAQASIVASEEAAAAFKGLIILRNARHVSYMKNLLNNNYCSYPESVDFIKNLPYQTKSMFVLDTAIDETTIIRAMKWKNIITKIPNKIRKSKIFFIVVEYTLNSSFASNLQIKSKEVGKTVLLN
jgi:hypothetical protein